jgi:hypothetical protein
MENGIGKFFQKTTLVLVHSPLGKLRQQLGIDLKWDS